MKFFYKINVIFTKSELRRILYLFFGMIFMGFFEVIGVTSIVPFIAVVVSPELISENSYLKEVYIFLNFQNEIDFIIFLGVAVILTLLVSNSYQVFMTWMITYFTKKQESRLSVRLLNNYLKQPYNFFLLRNTSDLGKNILSEVQAVTTGFVMQSLIVASKIIITLFIFVMLVIVDPYVALVASILLVGIYLIIYTIAKQKLYQIGLSSTKNNFQLYKAANESLSGIKDIKLQRTEEEFVRRFQLPSEKLANFSAQKTLIASLPRYFLEIIAFGGVIALIISYVSLTDGVNSSIFPIISLYVMAGYRLMPAIQLIYSGFATIKFHLPAFELLVKEFSNSTSSDSSQNHQIREARITFNEKLKISNLNFTYDGSEIPVLKDLDLEIYPNSTVGIVGTTGSGKTTLIDIILGLLNPISAKIYVDGLEVNDLNKPSWQSEIGYVPQSIYLIDDTIIANIAFAIPDDEISIEKVINAAKIAKLHDFIEELPEKYKTLVGDRGVRLSGGQRQRIGIARALYHDPKILVLDEATSSLDGITENVIMDTIKTLSHKKTIIMIAHRLSTVQECDIIHLMSNGKILNSGTFGYLMKHSGEFNEMAKNS